MKPPCLRRTPETRQPLWTRGARADPQPASGRDKTALPCHIMNVSESPFLNRPTRITTPSHGLSSHRGVEMRTREKAHGQGHYRLWNTRLPFLPGLHPSNCCSGTDGAPGTDPGAGDGGVTKAKGLLSWSLRSGG